jgi:two-component system, OmpR family, response regulator QseB
MRLLLIEDDAMIGDSVRKALRQEGFTVDWLKDGKSAELALDERVHDLVLLDLGLPKKDGIDVLQALRSKGNPVPVLVLTARDAVPDRVAGLDACADDYLVKPFDLDELVARIRAVARRGVARETENLAFADLVFDRRSRQTVINGQAVTLRPREAALLEALLRRAGEPVHRELLLSSLYSLDEEIGSNTLDVHVHHLRRRLAEAGARVSIATMRGHGYALRAR